MSRRGSKQTGRAPSAAGAGAGGEQEQEQQGKGAEQQRQQQPGQEEGEEGVFELPINNARVRGLWALKWGAGTHRSLPQLL